MVETRFGGLLFLLNVALALELWGDFSAPHDQRTSLSPWAWLAAIGERLCGASLRADPVWSMLEHLIDDGESTADPDGEDAWRIPGDWLRPFETTRPLRAFSGGGRLRLEHPAGFPLIDINCDEQASAGQLAASLRHLALDTARLEPVDIVRPGGSGRRRPGGISVDAHARYMRARLCLAFGVPRFRELRRLLLVREARLALSTTRLDATFPLATHPVEIRAGGLDRDPGWIPAAGRDIRLHFQ